MTDQVDGTDDNVVVLRGRRRITLNLTPQAQRARDQLVASLELGQTDVINRALVLYAYVEDELRDGKKVTIYDPETQSHQEIRLL